MPKFYMKASNAIINVSQNDLSKTVRDFDILTYNSYERKLPKHEPNDSYFHLPIQLAKCMMRSDDINSDNDLVGI